MKTTGLTALLFATAMFLGLILVGGSRPVSAQKTSVKAETKQKTVKKHDDDEDDNDGDDVTAEEARSVSVTLEAARATALERVKGTVIDQELEKEHGRLQYAFDIKDEKGVVYDVEVDAMTGEILCAAPDDEDDDDAAAVKPSRSKLKATQTAKTKPH